MFRRHRPSARDGFALIDAMIAIVLFSIGILGMVVLQGTAVRHASDAKYRSDAAMLADEIVARMWTADPASLATNFASPSGPRYVDWRAKVIATLPGAAANPPTIAIDAGNLVHVTVSWKGPNQPAAESAHAYESITQVTR